MCLPDGMYVLALWAEPQFLFRGGITCPGNASICVYSPLRLLAENVFPVWTPSPYDLYCVGGTLSLTQSIVDCFQVNL